MKTIALMTSDDSVIAGKNSVSVLLVFACSVFISGRACNTP